MMLLYLLKINIALIVLLEFYKLIFSGDTFFLFRRITLLGIIVISIAVPGLNLSYWVTSNEELTSMATHYATNVLPTVTIGIKDSGASSWDFVYVLIYAIVVSILLARFAWQIVSIVKLKNRCKTKLINGKSVYILEKIESPFSFFNWIFVNPTKHKIQELDEIITHEAAHCQQKHSIDIVVTELFTILFWVNPFAWLLRREVRLNLEYLADNRVLECGSDSKQYQYHLLGLTYKKNVATISNNFNVLPLKKRIKMMNKKRTKSIGKAKYALIVPMTAALLVVSNIESVARAVSNVAKKEVSVLSNQAIEMNQPTESKADKALVITQNIAETNLQTNVPNPKKVVKKAAKNKKSDYQMPQFGGNINVWLMQNVKYPDESVKKNEEGNVIVAFTIAADGSVNNPKVAKGVSPALNKEALRMISSMPKWKPAIENGKAIETNFILPVSFKLSKKEAGKATKKEKEVIEIHL